MARAPRRRAGRNERPSHEAFSPSHTAQIERMRAGTFTRWQDAHQGAPVSGTPKVEPMVWTLPRLTERTATDSIYLVERAPLASDRRAPKVEQPFARTIRKCEPAGPHATSSGFSTRL